MRIRDLVYFDFSKAASIWSQVEGGFLERYSITKEKTDNQEQATNIGIPKLLEVKIGDSEAEKRSILESKILHHDLLNRLEEFLTTHRVVADLSTEISKNESSPEKIHEIIGDKPYLMAQGSSVIEDYRRMASIASKFNQIVDFIAKSSIEALKQSVEYKELQQSISESHELVKLEKDRNKRALLSSKLQSLEKQINKIGKSDLNKVDTWIIDGMQLWISTFMPNRINFRIYPFPDCPSFQVLCNLKRECFVDQDLEHLLYGYGNKPNIDLAVFGLITSNPTKEGDSFDPLMEFQSADLSDPKIIFEKAFRGVFVGMEGVESIVRYSRYPNITIHPIAVYRDLILNK